MNRTITKSDIAETVYQRLGCFSKREAADLVDDVFDLLKNALAERQKVKISGFGNFVVRYKKPRVGRNPLTGEEIVISARHVATFKASPVLKGDINDVDA